MSAATCLQEKRTMISEKPEAAMEAVHPFTGEKCWIRKWVTLENHFGLERGQYVYECSDGRFYLARDRFVWKQVRFGPAIDIELYRSVLFEVSPHPDED